MKLAKLTVLTVAVVCLAAASASAQNDPFGKTDTLTLAVQDMGNNSWMVTGYLWHDEDLAALDVPIKYTAGIAKLMVDSVSFEGGRMDYFAMKQHQVDTTGQTMHIGGFAYLGSDKPPLAPGNGEMFKIYFSTIGDKKAGVFAVDTTFYPPASTMQLVSKDAKSIIPALKIIAVKPEKKK
jgi:hypothetical protein